MTDDDPRCCGTGTCLINADGLCWCGQQWDGEKMCFATPAVTSCDTPSVTADALDKGAVDPQFNWRPA